MAKTTGQAEQPAGSAAAEETKKVGGLPIKKLLMFGVPVLIVQLVVMYFVITKFVSPAPAPAGEASEPASEATGSHEGTGESAEQNIYVVKDLIVNPAGTNGTRFLLTTIGFEVTTGEGKKELENKDVQIRDVLNSILTSKDLAVLVNAEEREPLRQEISEKVGELLKKGSLTNVYFSKFIIQ
jgi:flagellar basal body-associated protein FliL